MRRHPLAVLSSLCAVCFVTLAYSLSAPPASVKAESNCTEYNQCAALQVDSGLRVQSPVTYWFDDDRINTALPAAAASDLKAHVRAAANDWATRTGNYFYRSNARNRKGKDLCFRGHPYYQREREG